MTAFVHLGRRTLQVGGLTREEIHTALAAAGVRLNTSAERLLDDPVFASQEALTVQSFDMVERTVGQLGLTDGATLVEIMAARREQGFLLCPPYAAPYLRLALLDQPNAPDSIMSAGRPPSGALQIASPRLRDDDDFPRGFYLRVVDGTLWLRGYRCTDDAPWSAGDRFVFRAEEDARDVS